ALQEQQRYKELVADGAAPQKTLDDATNQVEVLKKQLEAQISSLTISTNALNEQANVADKQKDRLLDRLSKCHIYAPTNGTVTEKYVERGEYVSVGKPLFKMADIQTMFLRAYITSSQLKNIKLGQKAAVYADYGNNSKKEYEGRVCWISSRSEFTPKTIVTDDERADLVYALKIEIKNDGYAKIGMYGEVKFK
ncbi:MAG: HlyD family secretion protein, partial [Bacteroidaceae bacterium]